MTKVLPIFQASRSCGLCTKCCEGWLEGVVHGHRMHRGRQCHFLETACTIYPERPENPCKKYDCAWLTEDSLPGWMKPNLSNVVVTKRSTKVPTEDGMQQFEYYDVIEAGNKMDSSVLNWLIHWALSNDINLAYELDGKLHAIGSAEFKMLFV